MRDLGRRDEEFPFLVTGTPSLAVTQGQMAFWKWRLNLSPSRVTNLLASEARHGRRKLTLVQKLTRLSTLQASASIAGLNPHS